MKLKKGREKHFRARATERRAAATGAGVGAWTARHGARQVWGLMEQLPASVVVAVAVRKFMELFA